MCPISADWKCGYLFVRSNKKSGLRVKFRDELYDLLRSRRGREWWCDGQTQVFLGHHLPALIYGNPVGAT